MIPKKMPLTSADADVNRMQPFDSEVILALELSLAKQRIRMLEETVLAQAADIARILRLIGALR